MKKIYTEEKNVKLLDRKFVNPDDLTKAQKRFLLQLLIDVRTLDRNSVQLEKMTEAQKDSLLKFQTGIKLLDKNSVKPEDLTKDQKGFLFNLNKQLSEIEKEMNPEMIKLNKVAKARLEDPNDWVSDYELECVITFFLNDNDSEYDEDIDNVLVELSECALADDDSVYGWDDNENYNEFQYWDHPMSKEKHCNLYHCLYDHTKLGWSNILRIGCIWIDVKIEYQKIIDLPFVKKC